MHASYWFMWAPTVCLAGARAWEPDHNFTCSSCLRRVAFVSRQLSSCKQPRMTKQVIWQRLFSRFTNRTGTHTHSLTHSLTHLLGIFCELCLQLAHVALTNGSALSLFLHLNSHQRTTSERTSHSITNETPNTNCFEIEEAKMSVNFALGQTCCLLRSRSVRVSVCTMIWITARHLDHPSARALWSD